MLLSSSLYDTDSSFITAVHFLRKKYSRLQTLDKCKLIYQYLQISRQVDCPHKQSEILNFVDHLLSLDPDSNGVIVEAGCYQGGSTSKFSLVTHLLGKQLYVFDSFQGIPRHDEDHGINIYGNPVSFAEGEYACGKDHVIGNISKFGEVGSCQFIEGLFDDTMPDFNQPVDAVYLDVDLVSSTKTCLRYLYPLLRPGGYIFSQDGHLPLVLKLLDDDSFWQQEMACAKPEISGLGKKKLVKLKKPL